MAFNELAFGKVLYVAHGRFAYSRIPHVIGGPKYYITTKGLVISGGHKSVGDLLTWEKVLEPGVIDGTKYVGLDFSGIVKFSTPITLVGRDGNKQDFPEMPTPFYEKFMQAWQVAKMFSDKDSIINRDIALLVWKDNMYNNNLTSKQDYLNKVYEYKIKQIFSDNSRMQRIALELYDRGDLSGEFIDKNRKYKIEEKINEILNPTINNNQSQSNTSQSQNQRRQTTGTNNQSQNTSSSTNYGNNRNNNSGNNTNSTISPSMRRNRNRNYQGFDRFRGEDR